MCGSDVSLIPNLPVPKTASGSITYRNGETQKERDRNKQKRHKTTQKEHTLSITLNSIVRLNEFTLEFTNHRARVKQ